MKGFGLGLVCSLAANVVYALPFTLTPNGSLPTSYPGAASYTITKNTTLSPTGNVIKWLPTNTSINPSGTTCSTSLNTPFTLDNGQSCTLNLTVFGPVSRKNPNPSQHLMVCLADGITCAGPAPKNSIDTGNVADALGYVADATGKMYYCTLGVNGQFEACAITPTNGAPTWTPYDVALATVNGAQYGYVADHDNHHVYRCSLNADGSFNTCIEVLGGSGPTGIHLIGGSAYWSPNGVAFATSNGTQYGYVADNHGNIYRCTLNADGNFNTCTTTPTSSVPTWVPNDVSFATINGTQYGYVADNDGNVYECTLNADGTFKACTITPSSGAPTSWVPSGLAFAS